MDHKHSGVEKYSTNPGHVDAASGPAEEKDEHAQDPKKPRRPVTPLPATPVDAKGRALGHPLFGL